MKHSKKWFHHAYSSTSGALVLAMLLALVLVPVSAGGAPAAERPGRLANLDHLDFLGDRVSPPKQARHTTYRSARSMTRTTVAVPGSGKAHVRSYDGRGRLISHTTSSAAVVPVHVAAGGVTLVRR